MNTNIIFVMKFDINFHELNHWSHFFKALEDQDAFINEYMENAQNGYLGYATQKNGKYTVIQATTPEMDIVQIVFDTSQRKELFIIYAMGAPDPYAWRGLTSCLEEEFNEVRNGCYIHKRYPNISIMIDRKKYDNYSDLWTVQLLIKAR